MLLITETNTEDVRLVTEATEDGKKNYFIEGIFMQANKKNRNGRIYPTEVLQKEARRYTTEFIKKKRAAYFSTKTAKLAGIETLLYQQIRPGVMFKGLVDLIFYHPNTERWTVMDIKTSTRGWNDTYKKNPNLTAQVILYREFFAKQFKIDPSKIDVEFFIVKRRVPAEAEFATQQRRVQEFTPASGPRKTKQVIESMNKFISDVLDSDNNYIDKEYPCTSPLGKCNECKDYVN